MFFLRLRVFFVFGFLNVFSSPSRKPPAATFSFFIINNKKMRVDGAHLFRYLFLKKLHSRAHFYQNIENIFCIETSKMNILSYVLWCLRCGKDAHGSCASFGYWFMGHSFEF